MMTGEGKAMQTTMIMVRSGNGVVAERRFQDSFEWNSADDRAALLRRIAGIGVVVMGSNTYRTIGGRPYPGVRFFVLTQRPEQFTSHPAVTWLSGEIETVYGRLEAEGIRHIALLGGPETNRRFLEAGRVDEIFLTIEPLLLTEGLCLTAPLAMPIALTLESVEFLNNSQTLLCHYRVSRKSALP